MEDEFEHSAEKVPEQKHTLVERNVITPDLGNVGKVAKKEGVIEVVEADDRQEKALSSGSAFSEISVKDQSEEGENKDGTNDAQILLDD